MKISRQEQFLNKPYLVIWSDLGFVKEKNRTFATIDEALDFSCEQREYVDHCSRDVVEYAKKTNHRILQKGGFQEFCSH